MAKDQTIKKPTLQIQEQQPRNIQRADNAPTSGFALVVDGHFKTQFEGDAAAQKAAKELHVNYPMLQIEVYDASTKVRTLVKDRRVGGVLTANAGRLPEFWES
jgi:hypothetical protein